MQKVNAVCIAGLLAALALYCKKGYTPSENERLVPMKEYSVGNSREYEAVEKELAPQVRKTVHNGKPALLVEVPHVKVDTSTYIEKIGVMAGDKELAVVEIKRERNPLTYAYFDWQIIPWSGKIKAFVKWNKYDLWVKEIDVKDLL